MVDYITVEKIMNDNNLDLIAGEKGLKRHCTEDMIARPGLEFAGFFDYFDATRVQLVGSKEAKFLNRQDSKKAYEHVRKIYVMS